MTFVPGPGIYGLVREDASLRLWKNRAADGSRSSWPIWSGRPSRITVADSPVPVIYALIILDPDDLALYTRPVRFGDETANKDWHAIRRLHAWVDERVWWTAPRANARARRALYMPAMDRQALIDLATDLEKRADRGSKQINHQTIGTWIRRVWTVIEEKEKADDHVLRQITP